MRPGEELNSRDLTPVLESLFPGEGPWSYAQYAAGHSNLTYLLSSPSRQVVLRRPPKGPLPPRAHDMVREYRLLLAIHPHYRWAPNVYFVSEGDQSVLGVPFFLMEARTGVLIDGDWLAHVDYQPSLGRRISQVMVQRLADLHQLEWRSTPLRDMVKPEGFMRRQVDGWVSRYQRAKTQEVVGVEALMGWLVDRVPESSDSSVIHYDYKLNNVLFTPELEDLSGIFDWEMATVGDPLADLAVAMSYWPEADDPDVLRTTLESLPVTAQPGFFTRREWVEAYARATGRSIRHFNYYLTFAYFKLAVILQQIYARYVTGQTTDVRFAHFGTAVQQLLAVARDQARRGED